VPFDRKKYPGNWEEISLRIRRRARGRCECSGECGIDHAKQGSKDTVMSGITEFRARYGGEVFVNKIIGEVQCAELNGHKAMFFKKNVVLTVAHMDHDTTNNWAMNLKAWCQRCHLRFDRHHHAKNAAVTRMKKKAKAERLSGQGHFPDCDCPVCRTG
jgi:hypothetical protein